MIQIKKPTLALITGHKNNPEGKLMLCPGWVSSGAWLIKAECLKAPARACKGIHTESIPAEGLVITLENARKDSPYPCELTDERVTKIQRRYNNRLKSPKDSYVWARFKSEGAPLAPEGVWASLLYIEWLAGLGPIKWFCGRDWRDPIRIENSHGETIALLMPVRP